MKSIDIVVPVYNEENNLERLLPEVWRVTDAMSSYRWRIVFVNDGSRDQSLALLRKLATEDQRVRVVDLARNFGKEIALTAGVSVADADAVICMDADLQHPPTVIPQLVAEWERGAEVVATVRSYEEKQPFIRRSGSRLFYYLMRRLSDLDTTPNNTDFRLLDRKVVDQLVQIGEKKRMFRALVDWLGFRRAWVEFKAPSRTEGESTFSYRGLWNLAFDSFISYSSVPLRLVGYSGASITFFSVVLLAWMLFWQLVDPMRFQYTPLAMVVVFNTLLIGIVLSGLGLMSLYINKIYAEVIERPIFSIREQINF